MKGRQAEVVAYRAARNTGPTRVLSDAPADRPVRVMIVDDQDVFRLTARQLVESTGGFQVVGEAESGEAAVDLARALTPDLVLMDVKMPGIDGLEATRRILAEAPGRVVILVLSTQEAGEYGPLATSSGAAAFISKSDLGPDRLAEAWAAASG